MGLSFVPFRSGEKKDLFTSGKPCLSTVHSLELDVEGASWEEVEVAAGAPPVPRFGHGQVRGEMAS